MHQIRKMMVFKRTESEFLRDQKKGDYAELDFAIQIATMGGTAEKIGKIDNLLHPQRKPGPRIVGPAENESGFRTFKAPDFNISLPQLPYGSSIYAEVKLKSLQAEEKKQMAFVYLDEAEKHAMERASSFKPTIFVIRCPDLEALDGYCEWMWVDIRDLEKDRISLLKRTVNDKPTFLLPIDLFQPLSTLPSKEFDYAPHQNPAPFQPPQAGYRNCREGGAGAAAP